MNHDDVADKAEHYRIAKRDRDRAREALSKAMEVDAQMARVLLDAKDALEAAAILEPPSVLPAPPLPVVSVYVRDEVDESTPF